MKTEIGEYIVGAYLKVILKCDFIDYNVRPPGGGLEGLNELDVVGLDFQNKTAYLCEVTTHIRGLLYGSNQGSVEKIRRKHEWQRAYAAKYLTNFDHHRYMFWSPVVPTGYVTTELAKIETLEVIVNQTYTSRVDELRIQAKKLSHDVGNPFFRTIQILEALKR